MGSSGLDFTHFFPEVYQAVAGDNYIVYAYMNDGGVRAYDVKPLIERGGVFKALKSEKNFKGKLTVMNNTIAWDIEGNRDEHSCIDIDPFDIFESPIVDEIPEII